MKNEILRIIDANVNRAREGLRVCEDVARFALNDKRFTRILKSIRHSATRQVLASKNITLRELVQHRNTHKDRTKFIDMPSKQKTDLCDVFMSNIERVKESLRVLEECSKIIDEHMSRKFRLLRFNTYDVEKRIVNKIRALSCNRYMRNR